MKLLELFKWCCFWPISKLAYQRCREGVTAPPSHAWMTGWLSWAETSNEHSWRVMCRLSLSLSFLLPPSHCFPVISRLSNCRHRHRRRIGHLFSPPSSDVRGLSLDLSEIDWRPRPSDSRGNLHIGGTPNSVAVNHETRLVKQDRIQNTKQGWFSGI